MRGVTGKGRRKGEVEKEEGRGEDGKGTLRGRELEKGNWGGGGA